MKKLHEDILKALDHYPLLKIADNDKFIRVKGEIILTDPEIGEFDRYSVSIAFMNCYPKCFPIVVETSNKIPRKDNRHVNPDGTLCLAVPPEERIITRNGISFKFFLDKILVPHLSRESFREYNGAYQDGEYGHGIEGIWQYYYKKLGHEDRSLIITELKMIISSKWPNRNDPCYCKSKKKFKQCHLNVWNELRLLSTEFLKGQINILDNEQK